MSNINQFMATGSTSIDEVRYNKDTGKLYIQFNTGQVYRYDGVSMSRYVYLRDAVSKGTYFSTAIKPNYPASRLPHGFPKFTEVNNRTMTA